MKKTFRLFTLLLVMLMGVSCQDDLLVEEAIEQQPAEETAIDYNDGHFRFQTTLISDYQRNPSTRVQVDKLGNEEITYKFNDDKSDIMYVLKNKVFYAFKVAEVKKHSEDKHVPVMIMVPDKIEQVPVTEVKDGKLVETGKYTEEIVSWKEEQDKDENGKLIFDDYTVEYSVATWELVDKKKEDEFKKENVKSDLNFYLGRSLKYDENKNQLTAHHENEWTQTELELENMNEFVLSRLILKAHMSKDEIDEHSFFNTDKNDPAGRQVKLKWEGSIIKVRDTEVKVDDAKEFIFYAPKVSPTKRNTNYVFGDITIDKYGKATNKGAEKAVIKFTTVPKETMIYVPVCIFGSNEIDTKDAKFEFAYHQEGEESSVNGTQIPTKRIRRGKLYNIFPGLYHNKGSYTFKMDINRTASAMGYSNREDPILTYQKHGHRIDNLIPLMPVDPDKEMTIQFFGLGRGDISEVYKVKAPKEGIAYKIPEEVLKWAKDQTVEVRIEGNRLAQWIPQMTEMTYYGKDINKLSFRGITWYAMNAYGKFRTPFQVKAKLTDNITDVSYAFYGAKIRRYGYFWNSKGVLRHPNDKGKFKDMSHLFENSHFGYETNDPIQFLTDEAVTVEAMFKGCTYLNYYNKDQKIRFTNFNNTKNAASMFEGCTYATLSFEYDMPVLENADNMFKDYSYRTTKGWMQGYKINITAPNLISAKNMFKDSHSKGETTITLNNVKKLKDIEGMFTDSKWVSPKSITITNAESISTFKDMFNGCTRLDSEIKITEANSVTSLENMFYHCYAQTKPIVVNASKNKNALNANYMFYYDYYVSNVDLTGLLVKNHKDMFGWCFYDEPKDKNAKLILDFHPDADVAGWTPGLTSGSYIFSNVYSSGQFMPNITIVHAPKDMTAMFASLTKFNSSVTIKNAEKIENTTYMFHNCPAFNKPFEMTNAKALKNASHMFDYTTNRNSGSVKITGIESAELDLSYMFYQSTNLNDADIIINGTGTTVVTNTENLFGSTHDLNQTRINLRGLLIKDMTGMFKTAASHTSRLNGDKASLTFGFHPDAVGSGAMGLYSINCPVTIEKAPKNMEKFFYGLYNFNSKVTFEDVSVLENAKMLFGSCKIYNQPIVIENASKLKDASYLVSSANKFNSDIKITGAENLITLEGMFQSCDEYNKPFKIEGTKNLKTTNAMFNSCKVFNSTVEITNASSLKDMSFMFANCEKLVELPIKFSTSSVVKMTKIFFTCPIFNPNASTVWFDASNVTDFDQAFSTCPKLNSSSLPTLKINPTCDFYYMFAYCKELDQDFSSWDVSKGKRTYYMFYDTKIYSNKSKLPKGLK